MRTPRLRHSFAFVAGFMLAVAAACSDSLEPGIEIVLSQPSVDLRAVRGTTAPVTRTITVSNSGDGRLGPVSCPANPAPWLVCAVSSGNTVTLTATPTGLTASPASVSVPFTAPGAAETQTVSVSLIIDQPVLTLSASTANFTASEGGAGTTPGSANITITNTGAGTLANLGTVTCAPTPANARVSCVVNQTAGTLALTVDPAGLAPGTYVFPVSVTSPNDNVSKTIAVTLANSALPRIVLSQQSLLFQMLKGGANPAVQTVTVSNGGGGNLGTVSCPAAPATWLSCAVSGGTTLTFNVNPTGLTSNPTPVNVPVTATGASNSPQTILVTFNIRQPVLAVSSTTADFVSNAALTATTPAAINVTVTNSGEGTLASLGTIACTPAASSPVTCVVDQTQGELTLTVNPAGITSTKIYPVVVSAPNSNVTRTITVTLAAGPTIGLSPKDLNFQAIHGSSTLLVKKVKVTNTGAGTLGVISCPANPATWLTCGLGTTADTLVFTANPTGLTQSPAEVVVPITAVGGFNNPQDVTVNLTILQPILSLSAPSDNFTVTAGGAPVSRTTIAASNSGAGNLANLGTISCGTPSDVHVTCSVNQTNGLVTLTVTPNTAPALVAGQTRVFSVPISAANMGNGTPPSITLVVTVQ